ncbi:MAG: hypothetical protein HC788_07955 [Sphingopyxis sp.]|nr:hypothetical protein [Sphingopyxis sp.]
MDEEMDAAIGTDRQGDGARRVLASLRPAFPAAAAAVGVALLAAFLIPMSWVSVICWQLYLDKIHPVFAEPLGNATRLALGLGFGILAMLVATLIALLLATPEARALWSKRKRADAAMWDEFAPTATPSFARRRRADEHPDAPPVTPINALRDLPPEGLVPTGTVRGEPLDLADPVVDDVPMVTEAGAEAVHVAEVEPVMAAALPDPDDMSLGAMVARFEAGLERRRSGAAVHPASPANEDDLPHLDLALEAALSTLQRMNKSAVG